MKGRAEPEQLGRCRYCGDGVWADMDHVMVRGDAYHRECAERLVSELEAAL